MNQPALDKFAAALERMIQDQIIRRGLNQPRLLDALRQTPRHFFVPPDLLDSAYEDRPLPIGSGQTISQPYIVALMTSLAQVQPGSVVLEVGTGSGYQAAILGRLVARVETVERLPGLAESARLHLDALGFHHVHVHTGDGTLGWQAGAPYDAILVTAAAPHPPPALLNQLAQEGRLVLPVGSSNGQMLQVWQRQGGLFSFEEFIPVVFVPLLGEDGWKEEDWRRSGGR